MFRRILGIILIIFTVNYSIDCFELQPRIINGAASERGQFPFYVYLDIKVRFQPKKLFMCGGSLLNTEFILTAGHCVHTATKVAVHLGSLRRNSYEDGRHVFFVRQKHIYTHPEYDDESLSNDIALIKLPRPAVYSELIQPIPLTTACDIPSGMELVAIGNGAIKDDGDVAEILQYATLKTISRKKCLESFEYDVKSAFCTESVENSSATCEGDSGGPLVDQESQTLYGITSFSHADGCEDFPQGFTKISHFFPWISEITGMPLTECEDDANYPTFLHKITDFLTSKVYKN